MASLVYVYAVLEAPVAVSLRGMDGAPVRWVEAELAAAVSDVAEADFAEEPLNERVRDLNWLGPRAIAHDAVNGQLWERAESVLPLAFGIVFRDDARVREVLTQRATEFKARLQRVRGKGEWVIALHADALLTSDRIDALKQEIARASAGRAHLLKRRLVEVEREEQQRLQAEAADAFVREAESALDGVYVEPIPAEATERPLVRATVLVRDDNGLKALVERWRERGYTVTQTGPTPPYRFAAT